MPPKRVLPRRVRSLFSFRNIRRELNSPSGTSTERGEREGRERCGWEEGLWEGEDMKDMTRWKKNRDKERRKDVSSLCCCAALCVNSRKWVSWRFHKTHKRNASFNIINQTSARSTHFLSAEPRIKAIHTHARKFQIKHHNTLNGQFIQSTKKYNRWFFT